MRKVIHQYKLRLTNLSQGNRSLKLTSLSSRRDLDLLDASHVEALSATEILTRIIAGKSVTLLKNLSSRTERANKLDLRLNRIYREVETIFEETGAYDLFLGYPWVEGKFLEENIARCPVMLFPVKLVRDFQKSPRWKLEVPDGEDILLNKTFFLAYEKFQRIRLNDEFWDEPPERSPDLQGFLNNLYAFFREHELEIHFNQELFEQNLKAFPNTTTDLLDKLPIGKLKFHPYATLGIFPQSDSSLLNDYESLETWPEVGSLEELLVPPTGSLKKRNIPETHRHYVVPVDQSQESALLAVKKGESIVVHGPPGTGKSQLILNLVADALAEGKRVLVCSQKRAALDVVYHRLAEVGLSRFAGLVHDYRSDRKRLFEQIRKQIDDIPAYKNERIDGSLAKWEYEFTTDAREIERHNQFFEELYQALNSPLKCGLRPHDLYQMAEKRLPENEIEAYAPNFDYEALNRFLQQLREIFRYKEFLREDYPWKNRLNFTHWGLEAQKRVQGELHSLPGKVTALHRERSQFDDLDLTLMYPKGVSEVIQLFRKTNKLLSEPGQKENWAFFHCQKFTLSEAKKILRRFRDILDRVSAFKILDDFPPTLLTDLFEHWNNYRQERDNFGRIFSLKYLKGRWYIRRILKSKELKPDDKNIRVLEKEVEWAEKLLKHYEEHESLKFFADAPITDTAEKLEKWYQSKARGLEIVKEISEISIAKILLPQQTNCTFDTQHWSNTLQTISDLESYGEHLSTFIQNLNSYLENSQVEKVLSFIPKIAGFEEWVRPLQNHFEEDFEELRAMDELLEELSPSGKAVYRLLRDQMGHTPDGQEEEFLKVLKNDFLLNWIESAENGHPELREVSSRRMEGRMRQYREKMTERQTKVAGLVDRKLKDGIIDNIEYNRLRNPVTYRGISHQVNKKRRLWPVRKLVNEYWEESLSKLIPCWLASPESVAAVFPMKREYFDLVIFDEASQCFVERAVPVMLRGTNTVIAGDSKQLQPLDLYRVKVDEDEDAFFESEIALEVESALDLAKAIFKDFHLTWHYRSQEEELINFSNHAFYEGNLNVIPPAVHGNQGAPISWHEVQGTWIKNRNKEEAVAVIDYIQSLLNTKNPPTIGVVTFNFHQQELIKDELEHRLTTLMEKGETQLLGAFLEAMEKEEEEERQGIFVKNIENVQGDERDVIIFSVGYAPDPQGKLTANFGLLNLQGGENRLNVAITRARKRVDVFCSFQPEALRVDDAKHRGPKLLKQYLLYARAVSQGDTTSQEAILTRISQDFAETGESKGLIPPGMTLADRVYQQLQSRGLKLARNVGDTNFKVDIAILNPEAQEEILLGIECEGPGYFSGKSAKEREIYRWNLLEQRGWKMHRVWSRNFFLDPEKEIQRILDLIA